MMIMSFFITHDGEDLEQYKNDVGFDLNDFQKQCTSMFEKFTWSIWPNRNDVVLQKTESVLNINSLMLDEILKQGIMSYSIYNYIGSDTEPPCTKNVEWYIFREPLIISSLIFKKMKQKVIGHKIRNNRNIQEVLENTVVYLHKEVRNKQREEPFKFFNLDQDEIKKMNPIDTSASPELVAMGNAMMNNMK